MALKKAAGFDALSAHPRVKAIMYSVLAVFAVFALFWLHIFNMFGTDDWLERAFLKYASPSVPTEQARKLLIVNIDEKIPEGLEEYTQDGIANAAWRTHHAKILHELAVAGARVVAFDLYFPAAGPVYKDGTEKFAGAIVEVASMESTRVVIGANRRHSLDPILRPAIGAADMGRVDIRRTTSNISGKDYLTRVLLFEITETDTAAGPVSKIIEPLPMPLAIYLASQHAEKGDATLDLDTGRNELTINWARADASIIDVEVKSCSVKDNGCAPRDDVDFAGATLVHRAVLPFWIRGPDTFQVEPYANLHVLGQLGPDYADRIVIVGAETEDEKIELGPSKPDDTIYGYHVIARVVADLMYDKYPRRAGAGMQFAVFIALLVIGIAARLRLPLKEINVSIPQVGNFRLPVGFFVVAAAFLFIAFQVFRTEYLMFDLAYHVLALIAGYFVVPSLSGLLAKPQTEDAGTES